MILRQEHATSTFHLQELAERPVLSLGLVMEEMVYAALEGGAELVWYFEEERVREQLSWVSAQLLM